MRLLVYALNFAPEPTGCGRYTGALVDYLCQRGHEVTVITAPPYYPAWRVKLPFRSDRYTYQAGAPGRPSILRCPLWVPNKISGLKRLLHLMTFALSSALLALVMARRRRVDVVLAIEPTFMIAPIALLAAKLAGARAAWHVQDLEIEAAQRMRQVPAPLLKHIAQPIYRAVLAHFDQLSTISRSMLVALRKLGVTSGDLALLPNGVAIDPKPPSADTATPRKLFDLPDDACIVLYAGSLGAKQQPAGMIALADRLRMRADILLLIVGIGPAAQQIEDAAAARDNLRYLPLQPEQRFAALMASADMHFLPQQTGADSFALPSKLACMLASGRPVVAQTAPGSEVSHMVEGCGLTVGCGDVDATARAICRLADEPFERRALGKAARLRAESQLDAAVLFARFERRLIWLSQPDPVLEGADVQALPARWA